MGFDCDQNLELSSDFGRLKSELGMWSRIRKFPLQAIFELTPLCNLRCPMCYVRLDKSHMALQGKLHSAKEWLELARQSAEMGLLFVTVTGGEPLLHPEFWDIYNGLTEMGILVTINSNGLLMDETVVEKLKANPPHNIKLSIYGASNETYERMCGVKDGFTRVSRAIDLLNESGLDFFCTTTVVHENMHDLRDLYIFARDKKLKYLHTTAVALSARGAVSDPLISRTTVAEEGWTLESLEKEKHTFNPHPFAHCGGFGTNYFMTWHWHMSFCAFPSTHYAQVEEPINVPAAWDEMLKKASSIKTPEECHTCEYSSFCKRCPGLLASESGDPGKVSETFCAIARDMHRLYVELKAKEDGKKAENLEN